MSANEKLESGEGHPANKKTESFAANKNPESRPALKVCLDIYNRWKVFYLSEI